MSSEDGGLMHFQKISTLVSLHSPRRPIKVYAFSFLKLSAEQILLAQPCVTQNGVHRTIAT